MSDRLLLPPSITSLLYWAAGAGMHPGDSTRSSCRVSARPRARQPASCAVSAGTAHIVRHISWWMYLRGRSNRWGVGTKRVLQTPTLLLLQ